MQLYKKINLGYKPEEVTECPPKLESKVRYPCLYISDIALSLVPDDVGVSMTAQVELELTGIRQSTDKNKKTFSYDFEVKSIQFNKEIENG